MNRKKKSSTYKVQCHAQYQVSTRGLGMCLPQIKGDPVSAGLGIISKGIPMMTFLLPLF